MNLTSCMVISKKNPHIHHSSRHCDPYQPMIIKKPLREAIFFVIKNVIIEGIFLPGDRLTEDDIAQQFNCSRTPVREALRKLEQENLLQVKPGIGMVISTVDIELLQQELEIRNYGRGINKTGMGNG